MKLKSRRDYRDRRHRRVRRKISGSRERPRMAVFLSNKHMYVQFIDDVAQVTLASVSTVSKAFMEGEHAGKGREAAKALGRAAAQAAKAQGVEHVVFDRGGFAYGARLSALADAAREEGLKF